MRSIQREKKKLRGGVSSCRKNLSVASRLQADPSIGEKPGKGVGAHEREKSEQTSELPGNLDTRRKFSLRKAPEGL